MSTTPPPPLPLRPRDLRFANFILMGLEAAEAYRAAGFQAKTKAALHANASRLRHRRDVADYIAAQMRATADEATLTIAEIRRFCARVVRAKIGDLDPAGDTGDLIKSHAVNESEMGSSSRTEKLDPFKAIEIELKLSGADPETEAIKSLAASLGALTSNQSTLPTGKL